MLHRAVGGVLEDDRGDLGGAPCCDEDVDSALEQLVGVVEFAMVPGVDLIFGEAVGVLLGADDRRALVLGVGVVGSVEEPRDAEGAAREGDHDGVEGAGGGLSLNLESTRCSRQSWFWDASHVAQREAHEPVVGGASDDGHVADEGAGGDRTGCGPEGLVARALFDKPTRIPSEAAGAARIHGSEDLSGGAARKAAPDASILLAGRDVVEESLLHLGAGRSGRVLEIGCVGLPLGEAWERRAPLRRAALACTTAPDWTSCMCSPSQHDVLQG